MEDKIIEMHLSSFMILTNVGLVLMLCVDRIITCYVTKQKIKGQFIDFILIINIIIAVFITTMAQLINNGEFAPVSWFKLSYLLGIFVILLTVYKAESLKIEKISTSNSILPSKNK